VSRLWAERSGVRIPAGGNIFLFSVSSTSLWGPSRIVLSGCRNASLRTQRPERGVDHSTSKRKG